MRQNRVILLYVSIVRRSADCASFVMESASSKIIILYGGHGYPLSFFVNIFQLNHERKGIKRKKKRFFLLLNRICHGRFGEIFYFFTNDTDATLIWRVQFKNTRFDQGWSISVSSIVISFVWSNFRKEKKKFLWLRKIS